MINNIIRAILFFTIGNICTQAQKSEYSNLDSMKFKVTIINNYFGRVHNRTIITSDSLSYETDLHRGNSKKISRLLKQSEKRELKDFLKDFPLYNLQKSYVNPAVNDGTQMSFQFIINNKSKEIFISNVYQDDLGKLVKLVITMLPKDFIQYKKELIYPY